MQMRYAKPEVFDQTHCLRPYISEFSHDMDTSINLARNSTINSALNNSNTSTNTIDFANNTIEQTNLLNFVENFSTNSPNFRTSRQQRPGLSTVRPMDRPSCIDQIRSRNLARLRHSPERFVVTRGQNTQKALTQILDKYRRQRQTRQARQGEILRMGLMQSKTTNRWSLRIKKSGRIARIVRCGQLTGEDPFLGPLRTGSLIRMCNPSTNWGRTWPNSGRRRRW